MDMEAAHGLQSVADEGHDEIGRDVRERKKSDGKIRCTIVVFFLTLWREKTIPSLAASYA
jgi:hypothetical protein